MFNRLKYDNLRKNLDNRKNNNQLSNLKIKRKEKESQNCQTLKV